MSILAFLYGVRDGFEQIHLSMGLTWEDDQDANESYDHGANVGEWIAQHITPWRNR